MQKKCQKCKYLQVARYVEPNQEEWFSESCFVAVVKRPFCKRYLETNTEEEKGEEK